MKKVSLILSTIIASSLLVGSAFAMFAVTDLAERDGRYVSPGTISDDTETNYTTLSWGGTTSLNNLSNVAISSINKVGVVSLKSTLTYTGVLSINLRDDTNNGSGTHRFVDYLKLYIYEGSNNDVEENTLPETGLLAQSTVGDRSLSYNSAIGTVDGVEYSIYVKVDDSVAAYYASMKQDVVSIRVNWDAQPDDINNDNKVIYYASSASNAYLYLWGDNKQNAVFPGIAMTRIGLNSLGQSIYKGVLINGYNKMILSDGTDYNKTNDILISSIAFPNDGELLFWKNDDGSISSKVFESDSDVTNYAINMAKNPGPMLQAFNWTLEKVDAELETIANAGYKAIQLSPLQPLSYAGTDQRWSLIYQPVAFRIADEYENPLGNKDELKALVTKADALGVDIIVDVVTNHLAAEPYHDYELNSAVGLQKNEPKIYSERLIHNNSEYGQVDDSETRRVVRGNLGGLPDLQTENPYVQERVISMLKEYIDCGVKGFRFDAAKHIETPDDGWYASNFWPNVIGSINKYGIDTYGEAPYAYGEILNIGGRYWGSYTRYIDVTDDGASSDIKTGVNAMNNNPGKAMLSDLFVGSKECAVLWGESHDTYIHYDSAANVTNMAYAFETARADVSTLYLPRAQTRLGDDTPIVFPEVNRDFCSPQIAAVNKLHNDFEGGSEYMSQSNGTLIVARFKGGNCGALIVDPYYSGSKQVTIAGGLTDSASYTNLVTGQTVAVNNGTCTVNFVEGIAVIELNAEPVEVDPTEVPTSGFAVKVTRGGDTLYYPAYDTNTMSYGKHVFQANDVQLLANDMIQMYDASTHATFNCAGSNKLYLGEGLSSSFTYNDTYVKVVNGGTYVVQLQLASEDDSYYIYH